MPSSTHGSQTRQKFMQMAFSKSEAPSTPQPQQPTSQMTFHFNVGESIRAAQKENVISNRQMAKDFEVSEMTIQRWRNSEDATLTRIVDLAEYFNHDFESFLELGR